MTRQPPIVLSDIGSLLGPGDFLWALRRRWLPVLCCAIAGLAAAALYVRFFPDVYTSRAVVRFNPPQLPDRFVTANDSMQAEQRLFALTQMLTSSVTARKQIESQGLYPEMRRFRTVEDLVPRFQRSLQVRRVNLAGVDPRRALPSLQLTFAYSSPDKARAVLMHLVEAIHEANRSYRGDQSIGATEFLKMQAEGVQERILELEDEISQLGMFDRVSGDHEWALKIQQIYSLENRLGHVQTSLRNLQRDRGDKQSELVELDARLRRVNALVNARTEQPGLEMLALRRREQEARAHYEAVLERYRADHPDAVDARKQLQRAMDDLEKQSAADLEAARYRLRRDLGARIDALRADIAALDETIRRQQAEELSLTRRAASVRGTTARPPEDNMEYMRVTREYEVLKEFHRALVKKQEEANIGAEMDRLGRGEAIELVEPPTLPTAASQPTWPFKLLLGFLAGAGIAIAGLWGFLLHNPVVRRERHLALWPDAPLLAEIPMEMAQLAPASAPPGFRVRLRFPRGSWLSSLLMSLALLLAPAGCSLRKPSPAQSMKAAAAAEQAGELRKAMVLYRKALRGDARMGAAHSALARLELEIGEVEQAYAHLLRAVELEPADQSLHLRLAELTYLLYTADAGRSQDTLLELEAVAAKLAQRWPRSPHGPIYQALALRERHRLREAVALLEQARGTAGDQPALLTQLASLLHQAGRSQEATRLLETLLANGTTYSAAYDLLYLQYMQSRETARAGSVLERKWATVADLDSALQLAAHLHAAGQPQRLTAHLDGLAARFPGDAHLPARVGDFWFNRGDAERSAAWYEAGLRRGVERPVYASRLVDWRLRYAKPEDALKLLNEELRKAPSSGLLQAQRTALLLDGATGGEQLSRARLELELILQRMPRSSFVRFHLGRAYLRAGDVVKARREFELSVRLDPNYAPGWLALAESDFQTGHAALALNRVQKLLAHAPRLPQGLLLKARIEASRGQLKEAAATLDRAEEMGAGGVESRLERARLFLLAGDTAQAARILNETLAMAPANESAIVLMARTEWAAGRTEEAIGRLNRALSANANSEQIRMELASASAAAGLAEQARHHFAALTARFPGRAEYAIGHADALVLLSRTAEAVEKYRAVQQQRPGELRAWLNCAAALSSAGRWQEARRDYEKALSISPENPIVLNNLAYVLARSGERVSYALELAQQARRGLPASPEIRDTLAYILLRLGMREQALTEVNQILAQTRGPARQPFEAIRVQVDRGDLAGAVRRMEEARDRAHAPHQAGRS